MPGGIPIPAAPIQQPLGRPAPRQNTYQASEHLGGRIQGQFSGGPALSGAVGAGLQNLAGGLNDMSKVWMSSQIDQEQHNQQLQQQQKEVLDA